MTLHILGHGGVAQTLSALGKDTLGNCIAIDLINEFSGKEMCQDCKGKGGDSCGGKGTLTTY